jgi:hypothetical protein
VKAGAIITNASEGSIARRLELKAARPRRNKAARHRSETIQLTAPNQCWSMDFVADALLTGAGFVP